MLVSDKTFPALCAALLALCAAGCDLEDPFTYIDGGIVNTTCGPGIYPCGSYGKNLGDKVENLEFEGLMDPRELCKPHKDKAHGATLGKLSFKDYFQGDTSCAAQKKVLLWVMVSAGWCKPCKEEVKLVQAKYMAGKYDDRLGIINVVFETTVNGVKADADFIKLWASGFNLTFPVVMEPLVNGLTTYFNSAAAPFNMLVNTSDMSIVYSSTGAVLAELEKKITEYIK